MPTLMRHRGDGQHETGAIAVTVALFMTVVLVGVGLSLDVGNAQLTKGRMQTAADNAALAVARDCALRKTTCSATGASGTAQGLVTSNIPGVGSTTTLNAANGTVRVDASRTVPFSFMSGLGFDSTVVRTRATASWNNVPVEGYPIFPMAIAWCDYQTRQPGSGAGPALFRANLALDKRTYRTCPNADGTGTWGSREGAVWLTAPLGLGGCRYRLSIFSRINAVTTEIFGAPFFCHSTISGLQAEGTYWLPVYRTLTQIPVANTLTLEIVGFVPVRIHGWRFTWGLLGILYPERRQVAPGGSAVNCPTGSFLFPDPCNGITGTFLRTVEKSPDFDYGPGSNLGATVPVLIGD